MPKFFPAGPGDNTKPVQWPALHGHITMRNGDRARYFGRCVVSDLHRLGVVDPKSPPEKPQYNIWLLDDAGRNRCSPGPSDHDFLPDAA